jgi:hypothetical protein
MQIAHSSVDANIADFLSIYRRAVFCLCPPGDDPARKAVFDAILSGCIPVIFEVATLYNQYPWHIGEEAALDISVSIPGGLVRSGRLDFMQVLLGISPAVIRLKQEAIARLAPRIQYSMPPLDKMRDRFDATPWDPPFADGVDVLLDGLHARWERIQRNQSSGIPPKVMTSREWSREYEVVKVKTPGNSSHFNTSATSAGKRKRHHESVNGSRHGVVTSKRSDFMKDLGLQHLQQKSLKMNIQKNLGPNEDEIDNS